MRFHSPLCRSTFCTTFHLHRAYQKMPTNLANVCAGARVCMPLLLLKMTELRYQQMLFTLHALYLFTLNIFSMPRDGKLRECALCAAQMCSAETGQSRRRRKQMCGDSEIYEQFIVYASAIRQQEGTEKTPETICAPLFSFLFPSLSNFRRRDTSHSPSSSFSISNARLYPLR